MNLNCGAWNSWAKFDAPSESPPVASGFSFDASLVTARWNRTDISGIVTPGEFNGVSDPLSGGQRWRKGLDFVEFPYEAGVVVQDISEANFPDDSDAKRLQRNLRYRE